MTFQIYCCPRTTAELEAHVADTSLVSADAPRVLADTVLDISGGERAFIEADEAKELLSPLTKPGNSYKRICFSNRSFGIGAANVAGPILDSVKNQLTEVDISDFVAGRPEDEALDVMRIFSKALEGSVLRYLNISDNALGEKGRKLRKLYLSLFLQLKLKVLHFHNNMTGDEGAMYIAEMVKRSPNVESFRCSATRIGSNGGVALSEALGTCTRLKKLDLRDNLFGVDAGLALSKTLPKLPDLVELYLSDLNLENKGTIAIAKALEQSAPQLEILLKMLPKYYNHVRAYDNTLITKKFGVHRITLKGGRKVRFVVMGNMFCTELRIPRKYDLKGSTQGRSTKKQNINENATLKDLDLSYVFHVDKPWRDTLFRKRLTLFI
ncbi:RAN GTPase-activating protein 2 [Zea mays]|uniref:RAN GTPase-activating protein 2 n=1 Tax=Zea mays TaxID=4577 RepID=A0A1D6LA42_MAIZE|nr:RAN GTPase-activating protein 2 [Zea mays]